VRAASGFLCSGIKRFGVGSSLSFFAAAAGVEGAFLISGVGLGEGLPLLDSSSPKAVNALAASMMLRSFSFAAGPFFCESAIVVVLLLFAFDSSLLYQYQYFL
jgi:hypothetical protein